MFNFKKILLVSSLTMLSTGALAFTDDFDDGNFNGWSTTGTVAVDNSPAIGSYSLRAKGGATAFINTNSTGAISVQIAATSLEKNNYCYVQYSSDGSSWTTFGTLANGQDNGQFHAFNASPSGNVHLRIQQIGSSADYCYLDDVVVGSGTPTTEITVTGSGFFGTINTGTTDTRNITVTNDGTANLNIGSVNGTAAPYSVTSDNCSNTALAPSANCNVTVQFAPTSDGTYNDTLVIPSDDTDEPNSNVSLSGTGETPANDPDINVTGSGSFGDLQIGNTATSTITVENTGVLTLNVGSLSDLSAPYSITSDACSNTGIVPSSSCNVTVRFAPISTGSYNDTLVIPSDDPDENPVNVAVSGAGADSTSCDYDCLSGNGNVTRSGASSMDYSYLTGNSGNGTSMTDTSKFMVPANAINPSNTFEGTLSLSGESSEYYFKELRDQFREISKKGSHPAKTWPEFSFQFVQHGTHIIPKDRGMIDSSHGYWEFMLEPGRVWDENGDNGYSRVAMPWSFMERNANCIHNGLLTFLFKDDGSVSNVHLETVQETCLYMSVDKRGLFDAIYNAGSVSNAATLKSEHEAEINGRLPTYAISELDNHYPGADHTWFGIDVNDMTLFGFVIDGKNYVSGCDTRKGPHIDCANINLPSYSTAKSTYAGTAVMRREKTGNIMNESIASHISDCANDGNWNDVTVENALDMSTGNRNLNTFWGDENSLAMNGLFLSTTSSEKTSFSCTEWNREYTPGTQTHYHTSDTYLVGVAVHDDLGADGFQNLIVDDIWKPIGVSKSAYVSRKTEGSNAETFTGWGLSYKRDDVAKIANFYNVDNANGLLDQAEFDAAMGKVPSDVGLPANTGAPFYYNNGFWNYDIDSETWCNNSTHVPYMSGYGGIIILMLPNGTTYYYFSDSDDFSWLDAARESNEIINYCN